MAKIDTDKGRQGSIPYFSVNDEDSNLQIKHFRGQGTRGQVICESRNYLCAHMKRNDPVSRRFIQYCSMQSSRSMILVRDGKTGSIIVSPPESDLWLSRLQVGIGRRAYEAEWQTLRYVGEEFFEEMDLKRNYLLGFADFYDICLWATDPRSTWEVLYAGIIEVRRNI